MATRSDILKNLHNYKTNVSGGSSNTTSTTQVETYNPRYPGFDEANYKKLESKVDALGLTGYEKEQAMDNFYVQVLPLVQDEIKNSERRKFINDASYEVSQIQDKGARIQAKGKLTVTELSQQLKEKYNIDPTANDEEVFNSWIESIPNGGQLLANYMNTGDRTLLYAGGLAQKTEAPTSKESSVGGIQSVINKESEINSDSTLGEINKVADWVNIPGKVTELVDGLVQKIPVVTFDTQVENLANKMNNLSEEEVANLYNKYVKMVKNGTDKKWKNDKRGPYELIWDAITGDKDALDRVNTLYTWDYSEAMPQDGVERNQWGDQLLGGLNTEIKDDDNLIMKGAKGIVNLDKNLLNFIGGSWGGLENYAEALGVGIEKMKQVDNNQLVTPMNLENNENAFKAFVADKTANFGESLVDAPNTLMGANNPNLAKIFANAPASFVKNLSAKVRGATNPLDTKVGLVKMLLTDEGQQAMIDRYGSIDNLTNTMNYDPVGLADDMIDRVDKANRATNKVTGGAVSRNNIGSYTDALSSDIVNGGTIWKKRVKDENGKYMKDENGNYITKDIDIQGINQGLNNISNWMRGKGWDRTAGLVDIANDSATNNKKLAEDVAKETGMLTRDVVDAGKATVNAIKEAPETIKNAVNNTKEAISDGKDAIVEGIAERVSGNKTAQDKLFQAQEPTLNRLSKERNTQQIRNKSDVANELIVKDIQKNGGELPTDTQSRVDAHERAMRNKWKEIEDKLGDRGKVEINTAQLADDLDKYIASIEKLKISKNKSDLDALKEQSADLRALGNVDLLTLEKQKEMINANLNDWDDKSIGNVYKNGMTELTRNMGKLEDQIISRIPGEFQDIKNDFGALADGYGDVIKANVKAQRAKYSDSLSNYSRIKGIGDILKGVYHLDLGEIGKGTAQMVGGEVTAKLKDKDRLITEGFKNLAEEMSKPDFKSAKKNKAGQPKYK